MKKLLGYLLNSANSDPYDKSWFYGIKDRILKRFGKKTAWDQQHIVKKCWSCNGTGVFRGFDNGYFYREVPPEQCYKCRGSGVFDEFWVLLEVWTLGNYEFHRPIQKIRKGEYFTIPNGYTSIFCDFRNNIEGYITHTTHKKANLSFWILVYIFTPFKAIKHFFNKRTNRIKWRYRSIKNRFIFRKINNSEIPF